MRCRWRRSCSWPSSSAHQAVMTGEPPGPNRPAGQEHPALARRSRGRATSRSRYPKSCAASTSRAKRPRPRRPRAPAASPAIKDSTTRTRSRRPSGSAASIATAATLKPLTSKQPTSGRGFPRPGASSANPVRSYTLLNHESPEFIRFVNPGDLRVAHLSCGTTSCHADEVLQVRKSMMTHGCMLWGAALLQQRLGSVQAGPLWRELQHERRAAAASDRAAADSTSRWNARASCRYLDPLPRFEVCQPGNILRIFERGRRDPQEIGIPNPLEEPGKPPRRLSTRGLGTENRTDPVFVGLQKTRLFDPTLNFLGTNDHPGDYRSSGCTACHVIYANDRSPVHSGPYAQLRQSGYRFQARPDHSPRTSPAIRSSTSFPRAIPDQPVHRLPHPSRHQRHE